MTLAKVHVTGRAVVAEYKRLGAVHLVWAYLGQAVINGRLRRKLKDREARLKFIATRIYKGGALDNTIQRATDLPKKNWKLEV